MNMHLLDWLRSTQTDVVSQY